MDVVKGEMLADLRDHYASTLEGDVADDITSLQPRAY